MPFDTSWYQEGQIVYTQYRGNVTLGDLKNSVKILQQLTQENVTTFYQIIDVTQMKNYPKSIHQLAEVTRLLMSVPNFGTMIIVGASGMARTLASVVPQLAGLDFKFVATMEEAESIFEGAG